MQRVCVFSNLGLAVIVFAAMIAGSLNNESNLEEKLLLSVLVLLFVVVATGLITYHRWMTVVAAMPVLFLSFSCAFLSLKGRWIWSDTNVTVVRTVVAISFVIATLELSSVVLTFKAKSTE